MCVLKKVYKSRYDRTTNSLKPNKKVYDWEAAKVATEHLIFYLNYEIFD